LGAAEATGDRWNIFEGAGIRPGESGIGKDDLDEEDPAAGYPRIDLVCHEFFAQKKKKINHVQQ
jgi:hypothetical protein